MGWRRRADVSARRVAWRDGARVGGPGAAAGAPVVRWQLPLPGWGEPAADGSAAYVLTRAHEVVALDAATGSLRWRAPTGGPGDAPTGSPVRLAAVARDRRRRRARRLRSRIGAAGLALRGSRRRRPRRLSRRRRRRPRRRRLDQRGVLYAVDAGIGCGCGGRVASRMARARRLPAGSRGTADRRVVHVASAARCRGARRPSMHGQARAGRVDFGAGAGAAGPPIVARQRRRRRAHRRPHRRRATRDWPTRSGRCPRRVVAGIRAKRRDMRALASLADAARGGVSDRPNPSPTTSDSRRPRWRVRRRPRRRGGA